MGLTCRELTYFTAFIAILAKIAKKMKDGKTKKVKKGIDIGILLVFISTQINEFVKWVVFMFKEDVEYIFHKVFAMSFL